MDVVNVIFDILYAALIVLVIIHFVITIYQRHKKPKKVFATVLSKNVSRYEKYSLAQRIMQMQTDYTITFLINNKKKTLYAGPGFYNNLVENDTGDLYYQNDQIIDFVKK